MRCPPTTAKAGSAPLTVPMLAGCRGSSYPIGPSPGALEGSAGRCVSEAIVAQPVCVRSRARRSVFILVAGHTHESGFGYAARRRYDETVKESAAGDMSLR